MARILTVELLMLSFVFDIYFLAGQLRLERLKYDPKIIPRAKLSVEPVLSRLGIDTTQEKPALLSRAEGPKQPAKIFFPPLSPSKRKLKYFLCVERLNPRNGFVIIIMIIE